MDVAILEYFQLVLLPKQVNGMLNERKRGNGVLSVTSLHSSANRKNEQWKGRRRRRRSGNRLQESSNLLPRIAIMERSSE